MELKIVDPTAPSFHQAVGISEERSNELSDAMDVMVRKLSAQPTLVRTCDVFNEIAHMCNNIEELVYCTINQVSWHAVQGRILCPPQRKGV